MKKDENGFIITEPLQPTLETTDDRLFQATCAAMSGMLANPNRELRYDKQDMFIKDCIDHAKELIKQLDNQ